MAREKRPPYLSFTLDAKKNAARTARAVGVEVGVVAWGLLELWEYVWGTKKDTVGTLVVDGCFGPNDKLRTALVEYGFLEQVPEGFRVRGADDWLFRSEAASKAGKASAESGKSLENLKQNHRTDSERNHVPPNGSPNDCRTTAERTTEQPPNPTQQPSNPATFILTADGEDPRPRQMLNAWNGAASGRIPQARETPGRLKKLARWLKTHSHAEWSVLVAKVNASAFLRGDVKEFCVSLDWVLKPENEAKVLDGNYDDHGAANQQGPPAESCGVPACSAPAGWPFDHSPDVCESHSYAFRTWWHDHRAPDPLQVGDFENWLESMKARATA